MQIELKELPATARALSFIRYSLENAYDISEHILPSLDSEKFRIAAIVYSDEERMAEVDVGGVIKCDSGLYEYLVTLVQDYLTKSTFNAFIVEDTAGSPSYPAVINSGLPYFSIGDNIYYFLIGQSINREIISKIIRFSGGHPFVAYLTKMNERLVSSMQDNTMTVDDCQEIAKIWDAMIVSAYDDESYLIIETQKLP